MVLSAEMKATIIGVHQNLNYGAKKIISAVKTKKLNVSTVQQIIDNFKVTGTTKRKAGSSQRRTIRTPRKIAAVLARVVSEDNHLGTHQSQRQIA